MHNAPAIWARFGRLLPWILGASAFVVYLATFANLGNALGARADVIVDADTGPFNTLISEWSLNKQYGDAWNLVGRSDLDRTQEHKIKHVLTGVLFGPLARMVTGIGIEPFVSAKLAGAFSGSAIVLLFAMILREAGVRHSVLLPMTLILAFAPGQWVFASLPESWPLTGVFVLLALMAQLRAPEHPWLLGAIVGLGMLNNIALVVVCTMVVVDGVLRRDAARTLLQSSVVCGAVALSVWGGSLTLLSVWDPDLRPDRVIAFLRFFTDLVNGSPDPLSMKQLVRSTTQIGVSSMSSVQPDPVFGSVITNWQYSLHGRFGMAAAVALLVMGGLGGYVRRASANAPYSRLPWLAMCAFLSLWVLLYLRYPIFTWFYTPALLPELLLTIAVYVETLDRRLRPLVWPLAIVLMSCGVGQTVLLTSLAHTNR